MAVSAAVPRGRGAAQRGATPHEKCARSAPSQRAGRSRRFLEVLTVFFSKKYWFFPVFKAGKNGDLIRYFSQITTFQSQMV